MQDIQYATTDVMTVDWSEEIQQDQTLSESQRREKLNDLVQKEVSLFREALLGDRPIISLASQVNGAEMLTGVGITTYFRGEISSRALVIDNFVNSDRWVDRFEYGNTEGFSLDGILDILEESDVPSPYLVAHGYSNLLNDLSKNDYDLQFHDEENLHFFDTSIWSKPLMANGIMRPRKLSDLAKYVRVFCPEALNPGNRARVAMEVAISVSQNERILFSK